MSTEAINNNVVSNEIYVSSSPHMLSEVSTKKIMWTVVATLMPAVIFSVYWFGMSALTTVVLSVLSAVIFEALVQKMRKKQVTVSDGSAALTGLLLAMCLPAAVPFYVPIAGSFLAIVVAKQAMGGLGQNIFNPAHIGRAALMVSWPVAMTTWTNSRFPDAISSATPLNVLKLQGHDALINMFGTQTEMYKALFLGLRNGCLGETSVVLLVLGGLVLIFKRYIDWVMPVCMIGTVGILTWAFGGSNGLFSGDALFHMMAGGLIIGAFFMITDYVTIPITRKGQIIFAVGCGAITVLIRLLGGYPEGVCYAILLMNCLTPLIDRFIRPVQYGRK
jgi:electron transport complex, RnfABCDGE type, D subunit